MKAQHSKSNIRHHFFHSMVVMGGSLAAAHCGGAVGEGADEDEDDRAQPEDGGPASSGGNSVSNTSPQGAGGTVYTGAGGVGMIEMLPLATGGAPEPVEFPGPGGFGGASIVRACPPSQWDCAVEELECSPFWYHLEDSLLTECSCNFELPTSEDECGDNENFVCFGFTDGGQIFNSSDLEGVGCECLPREEYANQQCANFSPPDMRVGGYEWMERDDSTILCGCGWVLLLK